jgi:hypothetical protein
MHLIFPRYKCILIFDDMGYIYGYRKRQLVTISMQGRTDEKRFALNYLNAFTICKMKIPTAGMIKYIVFLLL